MRDEFATRDTEATLATMVAEAYVNHGSGSLKASSCQLLR